MDCAVNSILVFIRQNHNEGIYSFRLELNTSYVRQQRSFLIWLNYYRLQFEGHSILLRRKKSSKNFTALNIKAWFN